MFETDVFSAFATAKRRRNTRLELNALSDHVLRDIGLGRDQIDDVASALSHKAHGPAKRGLLARGLSLVPLLRAYRTA